MTLNELLELEANGEQPKPKRHTLQEEHHLQKVELQYFRAKHPDLRLLLFSVPNAGKRIKGQGGWMIEEGLTAGVADLLLLVPNKQHPYLCIENKTSKGRQSPAQKHWQEAVENLGGKYVIVRSLDEFIKVVEEYLNDR